MKPSRTIRTIGMVFFLLMACTFLSPAGLPQDNSGQVDKILTKIEQTDAAHLWSAEQELEQLGKSALPEVRSALNRTHPFVRLACAKFIYSFDDRDNALAVILQVMEGQDAQAQLAAADLLGTLPSWNEKQVHDIAKKIEELAPKSSDRVKVSLWRTMHRLNPAQVIALRNLRKLVQSEDRDVREESALALAEMDAFTNAKKVLKELAESPTENGKLARAYLRIMEISEDLDRQRESKSSERYALLDEMLGLLKSNYYDPDRIKEKDLIEAAARGIGASLDAHTSYLDEKMLKSLFEEDLEGEYGGIGARVTMRKDKSGLQWLTVEEPIFSGPAFRANIKPMDKITEIEGESTINKDLSELVKKLRGKAATPVKFKIFRRGWQKEKEFILNREKIVIETTKSKMLPGQIGYIKLTTFGERNAAEVESAVKDLLKTPGGMKALIFDLRGNAGGYLKSSIDIASLFLPKGSTVVITRGAAFEEDIKKTRREPVLPADVPMIMLVDGGSASASEILAGALRDHNRARFLIGEKTYGKGSVQDIKRLTATNEKTALRLTIAKWFLPSNRTVEKDKLSEGGLEPDITLAPPENDLWKDAEFDRIEQEGKIDDYLKANFEKNKDLFKQLAESDGKDVKRYPAFDQLYRDLNTKAAPEDVRDVVRKTVRRWVSIDAAKESIMDYQTDVQLQRGILELCKMISLDPSTIGEYKYFAVAVPAKEEGSAAK